MFNQASERIIELISDVLKKMKGSNLKMIVLVGGFSGCKIIQESIKSFFPNYRVIVPEDVELAVLKGAYYTLEWVYSFDFASDFSSQVYNSSFFHENEKDILTMFLSIYYNTSVHNIQM
jgi:sugar (pentulose or hexulose) kinase